jgi:D-methionine transport system substrate-binding protein
MRFIRCLILPLLASCLIACQQQPSPNTLTIGTIAGPESDLVRVAKTVAHDKYDLNIRVVEFSDYNLPNAALNDGSIDANVYQHLPYLEASIKAHHYLIEPIGRTFLFPAGLYSKKVKSLKALPDRARIAIPNDPSNEARALRLLAEAKLITLNESPTPSVQDIIANPKKIRIKTLDAAQLPRILPDVDAAVINTTFAIPAGLNPSRDALISERQDSPYANLVVIQTNTKKRAQLEHFVEALHSDDVKAKAQQLFGNAAIIGW